jgi:hypothetical protein
MCTNLAVLRIRDVNPGSRIRNTGFDNCCRYINKFFIRIVFMYLSRTENSETMVLSYNVITYNIWTINKLRSVLYKLLFFTLMLQVLAIGVCIIFEQFLYNNI